MKLLRIELDNWSVFYGHHGIDLDVSEGSPVILVHGENGRGKTSILRAMLWCLYDEIKSQSGNSLVHPSEMVNWDAIAEGPTDFGVKLVIEDRGKVFGLHRTAHADVGADGDLVVNNRHVTLLPEGADPMPERSIGEYIDGILHRDVADFFFFDGEMLSTFELRLKQDRENAKVFVRNQIELALGLPFLRGLHSDLETLQSEQNTQIEAVSKKSAKSAELQENYHRAKSELEAAERDAVTLREMESAGEGRVESLLRQMSQVDDIKEIYFEQRRLEAGLLELADEANDIRSQIAGTVEVNWWFPLAQKLSNELAETRRSIASLAAKRELSIKIGGQIDRLKIRALEGRCPECGSELHEDAAVLHAEMDALELQRPETSEQDLSRAIEREGQLRRFDAAASVSANLTNLEKDLGRVLQKIDRDKARERELSEALANNTVDVATLEATLQETKESLRTVKLRVQAAESIRTQRKAALQQASNRLASAPEVAESDRLLLEALTEGVETVGLALTRFREDMRHQVEAAATELFLKLTNEPEYKGVQIEPDYSLAVVDSKGRALPRISAGHNQVLTMSFIGALGDSSSGEAPLVMDTPFGRLDTTHRRGILDWVANAGNQSILFVQSGEYDPAKDAKALKGKVGREYEIARIGENRSEIVKYER